MYYYTMSDNEEYETYEQVGSGASNTFPLPVNDLKIGGYALLKNFPCKVVDMAISKTGKHGHAKASITGIDIFTSKKYEEVLPTSHTVQSFVPKRLIYQVINLDGNQLSLMGSDNETRDDLDLPGDDEELSTMITNMFNKGENISVTILSAIGKEKVVECKKD